MVLAEMHKIGRDAYNTLAQMCETTWAQMQCCDCPLGPVGTGCCCHAGQRKLHRCALELFY